jgi:hypothetical protein
MATFYARKLHKLRHCDILMQYRTQETITVDGQAVTFLVSDTFKGEPLASFLARQPGGRLPVFEGAHLLHALAAGVEKMHALGEHHGALSLDNVIVSRRGLGFRVKVIDLLHGGGRKHDDVYDLIRLFHEATGGARHYAKHPPAVRAICLGLRRPLIEARFRDAGALKAHLETMEWS